jgi:hypothetical protein
MKTETQYTFLKSCLFKAIDSEKFHFGKFAVSKLTQNSRAPDPIRAICVAYLIFDMVTPAN